MAKMGNPIGLSPTERLAYAGEIIGAPVRIPASPSLASPVNGVVVDETLSLLYVRMPGREKPVAVPKSGLSGTILLGGRELPLRAEALRSRPEDRTKRLLTGGPRRYQ